MGWVVLERTAKFGDSGFHWSLLHSHRPEGCVAIGVGEVVEVDGLALRTGQLLAIIGLKTHEYQHVQRFG